MRFSWQTTLSGKGKGYSVYIFKSDDGGIAKIYNSETGGTAISTLPQIVTDETGLIKFWVDTLDYDLDQRFDVQVYDPLGNPYLSRKNLNIFDIKAALAVKGASVYKYTWNKDVTINDGECLSIVLPPGKEIYIPDGYTLTVNDGGDLLIFSL